MNKPAKLFITYSHRDKDAIDKLSKHLAVMVRNGEIEAWHDNEILPGDRWKERISDRLADSDILLYLTSAASLASENCNKELTEALQSGRGIRTIPVILEACDWQRHELSQFEVLPHKGKPVNKWEPESEGWQSVVKGIRKATRAIQATSRPMQEGQGEPLAYLMLEKGNFFMMLGQSANAINAYSQAIKIKPDFVEAYCNRGVVYGKKGNFDESIADFNQAIALQPDYAGVYCNRGNAYLEQGNFDQAIQDLTRAIELQPDFAAAYYNRGNTHNRKGKYDHAIQDFTRAIELRPDFAIAYHNRGAAYGKKGKLDEAVADLSQAIALQPDDAIAYGNRGTVWLLKQAWDKAKSDLKVAREKGLNIAKLFSDAFGSISDYEKEYHIRLPQDIRDLLTAYSNISQPFRPRARILQLLGDELIGNARLAIFELVKNAYDADANEVVVTLDLDPSREPTITIHDDGEGMTLDTLRSVWLVPGNDYRQKQRQSDRRSPRHHRLPLGEKGLGRFAVHKLGNLIHLVTRARDAGECVVEIDWNKLIAQPYLDEAPVAIQVRRPDFFTREKTGTRIEVRQLRTRWSRGEVRRLHNQITSICSPFEEPGGFQATLRVPGGEDWLKGLPDVSEILDRAIWKFSFRIENDNFDWTYEFRQVPRINLEGRKIEKSGDRLKLPPRSGDDRMEKNIVAGERDFEGIGSITGEFYVYDRGQEVRKRMPNIQQLEKYLDEVGGVRVYRDGIRVYNYGERGDDWLGLDLRRVNVPTRRISRNIILGAIHLSLKESTGLMEKTNREGFVENEPCRQLQRIVLGALGALEAERQIDKEHIRQVTGKPDDPTTRRIEKPIRELRRALKRQGLQDKFEGYVARIENNYQDMQETLLVAGMSGLSLAIVFHEVERGVRALHQILSEGTDMESAARQARDLVHTLDGFAALLRRGSKKRHSGRELVAAARQNSILRIRHHQVKFVCPLLEGNDAGFHSRFVFGLVLGALTNLVDNAFYWLRVRWPDVPGPEDDFERKLYIGLSRDFEAGPAIVVADNGAGFQGDDPENLVRPFFTRKPEGMGLGLYYANLAMELNGGQLAFPQPGEVELPDEFDGATVALIFKESR